MTEPATPPENPLAKLAALMAMRREPKPHLTVFGDCAFDMSKVTAIRPCPSAPAIMQLWHGDKIFELQGPAAEALRKWIIDYRKDECVCSE